MYLTTPRFFFGIKIFFLSNELFQAKNINCLVVSLCQQVFHELLKQFSFVVVLLFVSECFFYVYLFFSFQIHYGAVYRRRAGGGDLWSSSKAGGLASQTPISFNKNSNLVCISLTLPICISFLYSANLSVFFHILPTCLPFILPVSVFLPSNLSAFLTLCRPVCLPYSLSA